MDALTLKEKQRRLAALMEAILVGRISPEEGKRRAKAINDAPTAESVHAPSGPPPQEPSGGGARGGGRVFRYKGSRFWWLAYYHHGREIRESAGTEDREKAERMLRKRVGAANTPHFTDPTTQRLSFDDLAEGYLRDYRLNGRRSLPEAERYVRHLGEAFGFDRALAITSDRVAVYTEQRLAAGARPATVNRELAALRRMFRLAEERLRYRPRIRFLAEDNVREGFLEPADFEAVCGQLPADVADAVRFAYLVGWRRGEVRTLEWRDVHLEHRGGEVVGGTIRLRRERSKTKRSKLLVLRADLLALIARRAARRRLDCSLVFHCDGKPLGDFRRPWRAACEAAGMSGRLFHDLRRSAVRNMVRAGVPERVAMAISGHRTRSVFDRYNIVSEDDIAAAVERTAHYVMREAENERRVEPLAAAVGHEHGEWPPAQGRAVGGKRV